MLENQMDNTEMHNPDKIPHILKYIGSKRELLNDIDSVVVRCIQGIDNQA